MPRSDNVDNANTGVNSSHATDSAPVLHIPNIDRGPEDSPVIRRYNSYLNVSTEPEQSLRDILIWIQQNGMLPLPAQPRSKKVAYAISTAAVTRSGDNKDGDSFHNPTPERRKVIIDIWNTIKETDKWEKYSVSLDTEYPVFEMPSVTELETVRFAAIDLDTDEFLDVIMEDEYLSQFPATRGAKGVKLLLKIRYTSLEDIPKIVQFFKKTDTSLRHPVLEFLSKNKHALIYGEHQASKPEKRIYYKIIRGFGDTIPIVDYSDFIIHFGEFIQKLNLQSREDIKDNREKDKPCARKHSVNWTELRSKLPYIDKDVYSCLKVADILTPIDPIHIGSEIKGEHPIHGSTTGSNLSINPEKNLWKCHRCDSGGGPIEAAAVASGLIHCHESVPGWYKHNRTLRTQALTWLKMHGFNVDKVEKQDREFKFLKTGAGTDIETIKTEMLPEFDEIYDEKIKYTLISGPPRIGKTFLSMSMACRNPGDTTYVVNRHAINEQAFETLEKMINELNCELDDLTSKTAVWLAGKTHGCRFDKNEISDHGCKGCLYYPFSHAEPDEFAQYTLGLIAKHKILDHKRLADMNTPCPYYSCKFAEKYANICLTVPHYLVHGEEMLRVRKREMTIIDEDSTISHFYPSSVELAIYSPNTRGLENVIGHYMDTIDRLIDHIANKDGQKEDAGKRVKKKRISLENSIIVQIFEKYKKISDLLDEYIYGKTETTQIGEITRQLSLEELKIQLNNFNFELRLPPDYKLTDEAKQEILLRADRFATTMPGARDDTTATSLIETYLYKFEPRPLSWIGSATRTLFLVGDERRLIKVPDIDRMTIIGFTQAEMFIDDMKKIHPGPSRRYEIQKFKFGKNFVILRVGDGMKKTDQKKLLYKLMHHIHKNNKLEDTNTTGAVYPSLVLTSSMKKQDKFVKSFDRGVLPIRGESKADISLMYWSGAYMPFYANSRISRGIDVDMFDLIFITSTDFQQPYYSTAITVAEEENNDAEAFRLNGIRNSLISDEITNCMLRISNVHGRNEDQIKIVVITDDDYNKISPTVLQDMTVYPVTDERNFPEIWKAIRKSIRGVKAEFTDHMARPTLVDGLDIVDCRNDFDIAVHTDHTENVFETTKRAKINEDCEKMIMSELVENKKRNKKTSKLALVNRIIEKYVRANEYGGDLISAALLRLVSKGIVRSVKAKNKKRNFYFLP